MTHKTKNVPKGPRNSTMFVFFSKNAYFSCFRMISVDEVFFLDAARNPRMQLGRRGCSSGAADAAREPRLRFCPTSLGYDKPAKLYEIKSLRH